MSEKVYCKNCKYFYDIRKQCSLVVYKYNKSKGCCDKTVEYRGCSDIDNKNNDCIYYEPNFITFFKQYILGLFK